MSQHTPGPWDARFGNTGEPTQPLQVAKFWSGPGAYEVLAVVSHGYMESKANARLMAAAPDLLAALQAVNEFWAGGDAPEELTNQMRAAIAKATGAA